MPHGCYVSGVSQAHPSTDTSIEELRQWLEARVRNVQFVQLISAIIALVTRMRDMNTELTRALANLRRARPRSERLRALEAQLSLPWAAAKKETEPEEPAKQAPAPSCPPPGDTPRRKLSERRRSKSCGRNPFPKELERVPLYNGVPKALARCPKCGLEMRRMGFTHCEHLDVIPAKVVVVHRSDEAVKCPLDGVVVSAPPPPRIVPKGVLGNRLIVEATADKFIEHQPVERQCLRFKRMGANIAPQTLGRGVGAHLDLLAPLAAAIRDKTRGAGLLGTDATGIPVLDDTAPEGIRTGTMWAWTNALWVSFCYSPKGDSDSVRRFLGEGNYEREIQADGTNLLSFIERAGGKRPGCWSHARRGLVACARGGDRTALEGVKLIAPLFEIERQSKKAGDNAEQRKARRQAESKPVVEALRVWLDQQRAVTPPRTALGKALGYLHRQWQRLNLFLDDGNIALTNNRRERELRKLVLGRRNWLFVWKDAGGERTADILTIVGTCISYGLDPRKYLMVVTEALLRNPEDIESLLPDRLGEAHPELKVPDFQRPPLPD